MLQECSCGEPLLDTVSRCPKCGKANTGYRQSRWRVFWPDIDTFAGADDAIRLGYWAAFFAAALGTITAVLRGGANLASLIDAAVFALLGLGTWRKWRVPALLAFLLILANSSTPVSSGHLRCHRTAGDWSQVLKV